MAEHDEQGKAADEKPRRKRFILEFLGWAAVIFAIVFFAPLLIQEWKLLIGSKEELGVFGDQFGAVNALFSGLAFAGVIVAMRMQSKELQLQREELKDTRRVMTDQKEQLALQAASMQRQTFENTFFQMISLYNQIVDEISLRADYTNEVLNGKQAIAQAWSSYQQRFTEFKKKNPSGSSLTPHKSKMSRLDTLNKFHCLDWYSGYGNSFGHYFRHFYQIVKFIDQRGPGEERAFYAGIMRAQLSTSEQALIYYNMLSTLGREKAMPLYHKYRMFDNLDPEQFLVEDDAQLIDYLAKSADESEPNKTESP